MKDLTIHEIYNNINQKSNEPIFCRIQRLCEKKNITIGELSTKLGIFKFNDDLTIGELRRISRYFGCSIEYIVNGNFNNFDNIYLDMFFKVCNEYIDNFDSKLINFNIRTKQPLNIEDKKYMMKISVQVTPSNRNIKPGGWNASYKTESTEENNSSDYNVKV